MDNERPGWNGVRCTVAIPVFNRQDLVRRTLDSALAQTLPGLEVLVVDNCSTDATWDTLQSYAADPRLRLVRNERNVGLFGNFNRCLSLARGEFLRFLCSDDRLAPDCLRAEVAVMDRHPEAAMLTTRARHVDEKGRLIRIFAGELPPGVYDGREATYLGFWLQVFYGKNPFNCPSGVLVRRNAAEAVGLFDVDMQMTGDLEYYYRLLRHGGLAVMDAVGCDMMLHVAQESTHRGYTDKAITEFYRLIEDHADVINQYGSVAQIQRQAISWLYWQQLQAWSVGQKAAPSFREQRRRSPGYSRPRAVLGLAGMTWRRGQIKLGQPYPLPFCPRYPLNDVMGLRTQIPANP